MAKGFKDILIWSHAHELNLEIIFSAVQTMIIIFEWN